MHTVIETRVIPEAFKEELRNGHFKAKSMHFCSLKSMWPDFVGKRVVAMSDIHGATTESITKLIKRKLIDDETIVLCTGDMAGTGRVGSNDDPFDDYVTLKNACRALYLVQGNHDVFNAGVMTLMNRDGSPCCVHRQVIQTPLGRLGGINGIMVDDDKANKQLHKFTSSDYTKWLNQVLQQKPDILLTHTPVKTPRSVPLHLFGHDHFENYIDIVGPNCLKLNMDCRIFVFQ